RAAAAGLPVSSAASGANVLLPPYRFTYMVAKAQAFCGSVRALGSALLSALEKEDGEELAVLRAGRGLERLQLAKEFRTQQLAEAEANVAAIEASRATSTQRRGYYQSLINVGLLPSEKLQRDLTTVSMGLQVASQAARLLAPSVRPLPEVNAN